LLAQYLNWGKKPGRSLATLGDKFFVISLRAGNW
jgi:hypothetical protein